MQRDLVDGATQDGHPPMYKHPPRGRRRSTGSPVVMHDRQVVVNSTYGYTQCASLRPDGCVLNSTTGASNSKPAARMRQRGCRVMARGYAACLLPPGTERVLDGLVYRKTPPSGRRNVGGAAGVAHPASSPSRGGK